MSLSLSLSNRLHEIVRQTSIRSIYEAIVELVTNADDAYRSIGNHRKDIWIEIVRGQELSDLLITDQAIGMTYDEMLSKLLVVGSYTASESSRGMMGRGAKDCSFLGDVTFTCIKDNLLNEITIHRNLDVSMSQNNVDVSPEHRIKYGILENGCRVQLSTDPSLVPEINTIYISLCNNLFLRNMLQDSNSMILLKESSCNFNKRLYYRYPDRKLIISCDYDIPGYNSSAHLEIYKSSEEIPLPVTPDQLQYGILVCSDKSVYESSALYHISPKVQDYMWNPNVRFVTGILICNDIDNIAREAANGKISASNPYLLIDPNRRNGLVRDHPFTIALYKHAYHLLDIVIAKIQDYQDDHLIDSGNASDVFESLNQLIGDLLPPESVLYTWRTKDDHSALIDVASSIKNVNLDSGFLGLTWDEIQNLDRDKFLQIKQTDISGSSFKISFTNDPKIKTPYQIQYLPGQTVLKINPNDPSIKDYVEISNGTVNLINPGKALTSVGSILVEATNNMVVRRNIISGKTVSLDINSFNEYIFNASSVRKSVGANIYSRISDGIRAIKTNPTNSVLIP